MADHYLEFSETLTHLTGAEVDWLQNQLETVHVIDGTEYTEDKLPGTGDATWIGCWIHSEEHGCVDRVAHLVQRFLRAFRPDGCWSLTYAGSEPRGGGAVFVTATNIEYFNAWLFVEQQEKRHGLQKDIARLVDRAGKLGLQAEDLDEMVRDAAGSLAASIDNAGLDEQVAWLVDQLGIGDVETCITFAALTVTPDRCALGRRVFGFLLGLRD